MALCQASQRIAEVSRAAETAGTAAAAASSAQYAAMPTVQAVDTRTIGKPKTFDGRREGWKEFRFVFEAFAGAAHPSLGEVMNNAEAVGNQPVDTDELDIQTMSLSRQLYYMLVMVTTDDASRIIRNVDAGNGAEAWRRL